MTSEEASLEVSPATTGNACPDSLPMKPLLHPRRHSSRHTLLVSPLPPQKVGLPGLRIDPPVNGFLHRRNTVNCGCLGSPLSQRNRLRVVGVMNRAHLELRNRKSGFHVSPSVSSYSTSQTIDFDHGSPLGCVLAANGFNRTSMANIPPEFSARVARALNTMQAHSQASVAFRSVPGSPRAAPSLSSNCYLDLHKPLRDDDSCIDAEMIPEEVPILLAQMNNSSLAVNQCENQLCCIRQLIAELDNNWRAMREKLMSSTGANHIQRADPFYTKLREIRHRKEHCSKLAQRYAHLSTIADQIAGKEATTEREIRWLQIRIEKSSRLKTAIEKQMATCTETVAKLQQELSATGQEHALSVKKAESFFIGYSSYLDNRKKAMQDQKEIEEKVAKNKDLYKAAMDGLESLSQQIHQNRGTLGKAKK